MEQLLLGIDLGAGSLKASLVNLNGRSVGEGASPVVTHSPVIGWSEQSPGDWWQALKQSVAIALKSSGVSPSQIAAISFSAGAHSAVLADKEGTPLRRAIMWNDQRSGPQCEKLRIVADDLIRNQAKNRVTPTWTLPQFMWLVENEPELIRRVERVYLAKDWLRSKLTGDWCTDLIDAFGTLMVDNAQRKWSEDLCALIGWSSATLPPIVRSTDIVGVVTKFAAEETGLAPGTPVVCGMSDTAAEALGAGMLNAGIGVVKLATAATLSSMKSAPDHSQELISYPYYPDKFWFQIAGTNSCASAHMWLRRLAFVGAGNAMQSYDKMESLARAVPAGSEGLFFHPYLNGERAPYYDPKLRASFVGLGFHHKQGHLIRALYEGIACSLRDVRRQFEGCGIDFQTLRITGGGSRSPLWRQILADVLNVRIELPEHTDASFGIALVAGLGAGLISGGEGIESKIRVVASHEPNPTEVKFYNDYFCTYLEIQQALRMINHSIVDLYQ